MIKTIKEGQKVFTRICNRCGCEFSYELEDLNAVDFVQCPCCHKSLTHIGIPATSDAVLEPHVLKISCSNAQIVSPIRISKPE